MASQAAKQPEIENENARELKTENLRHVLDAKKLYNLRVILARSQLSLLSQPI